MKSIVVSEKVHEKFMKLKGKLEVERGETVTFNDVAELLLSEREKKA